jgi:hypothetical protein
MLNIHPFQTKISDIQTLYFKIYNSQLAPHYSIFYVEYSSLSGQNFRYSEFTFQNIHLAVSCSLQHIFRFMVSGYVIYIFVALHSQWFGAVVMFMVSNCYSSCIYKLFNISCTFFVMVSVKFSHHIQIWFSIFLCVTF